MDSISVICLISPSWDMICTYLHNMATYLRVKSRTCVYVFPSGSVHLNIKDNYCLSVSLSRTHPHTLSLNLALSLTLNLKLYDLRYGDLLFVP